MIPAEMNRGLVRSGSSGWVDFAMGFLSGEELVSTKKEGGREEVSGWEIIMVGQRMVN